MSLFLQNGSFQSEKRHHDPLNIHRLNYVFPELDLQNGNLLFYSHFHQQSHLSYPVHRPAYNPIRKNFHTRHLPNSGFLVIAGRKTSWSSFLKKQPLSVTSSRTSLTENPDWRLNGNLPQKVLRPSMGAVLSIQTSRWFSPT